jgi:hypothetical protein
MIEIWMKGMVYFVKVGSVKDIAKDKSGKPCFGPHFPTNSQKKRAYWLFLV